MISLKSGGKIMSSKKKGDLDMNYSPLRYPGGKSKIAPFISLIIEKINIGQCIYVEPFAGGAGVALSLLLNRKVSDIVINDKDDVIGYISIDGKVRNKDRTLIGKIVSSNLVVDNNGKIIGYAYRIGANILNGEGMYIGRLSANGEVRGLTNGKIGYLKSNGSYINTRNKVSGYVIDEVAQNRRK